MPTPTPGRRASVLLALTGSTGSIGLFAPMRASAQVSFHVANESNLLAAVRYISADFARGSNSGPFDLNLIADITTASRS